MSITINNANITGSFSGKNITIKNGKVIIDGKDVTPDGKKMDITVTGNIDSLNVDCCDSISITGEVGSVETTSGNVTCGNVKGDVSNTSGDVKAGDVSGNVKTMSGDVEAKSITGSVKTMSGDIRK